MLHTNPDDQRIAEAYKKGGEYFMKGMELLSAPVTEVWIPYEGTRLKGYFFRADTGAAAVSGTTAGTGTERAAVSGTTAGTGTGTAAVSNTVTAAEIAAEADKRLSACAPGLRCSIESTKHIAEERQEGATTACCLKARTGIDDTRAEYPLAPDWNGSSAVVDYAVTILGVDERQHHADGYQHGGGSPFVPLHLSEAKLASNPGYLNVIRHNIQLLTTELYESV